MKSNPDVNEQTSFPYVKIKRVLITCNDGLFYRSIKIGKISFAYPKSKDPDQHAEANQLPVHLRYAFSASDCDSSQVIANRYQSKELLARKETSSSCISNTFHKI